ncbi:hypothetical protein Hanom_Chr01g00070111 [Helianthus anomalus]
MNHHPQSILNFNLQIQSSSTRRYELYSDLVLSTSFQILHGPKTTPFFLSLNTRAAELPHRNHRRTLHRQTHRPYGYPSSPPLVSSASPEHQPAPSCR